MVTSSLASTSAQMNFAAPWLHLNAIDASGLRTGWSNRGGNISIEKKQGGSWRSIASRASSPVVDSDAAVGEQLYRAKNGREVVAQIGVLVESKDQQSGSMMMLGGLGAVLLLAFAVGMSGDAIPSV